MVIFSKLLDITIISGDTLLVGIQTLGKGDYMRSITGVNGTIELLEDRLILKRGKLLGNFEKTVYLSDVIEVRLKKPGLTRGLLTISTALDRDLPLGSVQAKEIALKSNQWGEAVEFNTTVEEAAARVKSAGGSSAADEISKFKRLLDDGVITEEEFSAKKKQLLGI